MAGRLGNRGCLIHKSDLSQYINRFLTGDTDGAKVEAIALVPGFTQSFVKLASVYMEQGVRKKHSKALTRRLTITPTTLMSFIKGQILFIMNK
ncbi:hypothetical protein AX14_005987 [Amanita brunnescens Koide BX004]|nr:hypothetical protein AX14_005987 [Amanita brunnescens Koide BX004]